MRIYGLISVTVIKSGQQTPTKIDLRIILRLQDRTTRSFNIIPNDFSKKKMCQRSKTIIPSTQNFTNHLPFTTNPLNTTMLRINFQHDPINVYHHVKPSPFE